MVLGREALLVVLEAGVVICVDEGQVDLCGGEGNSGGTGEGLDGHTLVVRGIVEVRGRE